MLNSQPERLECGLVVRSIGQCAVRIDPDLPFDTSRGVIATLDEFGRVPISKGDRGALLYASGWAKLGGVGVILNTLSDARLTAETIIADLVDKQPSSQCVGFVGLMDGLKNQGSLNL